MKVRKISSRSFLVLIALILAALACGRGQAAVPEDGPAQVSPQGDGVKEGEILFQDDFQDGKSDGWDVTASWYVQQSGDTYTFDASGSGGAWVPEGGGWSNYAFQVSTRLDAGSLLLGFNLTPTGRYFVRLDGNGLYLIKEYPAKNYTVLQQTGPVSLGDWHKLDIKTYNGHIQISVDQTLWVDYEDTAPLSKGTIAVTSQDGSQVSVDDVLVIKTGPLTSGSVQAPEPSGGQPELIVEDDQGLSLDQVDVIEQNDPQPELQDPQPEPQDPQTEQGGLPELHISGVSIAPNSPAPGTQVIVTATVFNGGDGGAGEFTVRWYPNSSDVVGCSWDLPGLPAGSSSATGGCVYSGYGEEGTFEWRAIADADNDIDEGGMEGNNVHTGTIVVQPAVIEQQPEVPAAPTGCTGEAFGRTSVNFYWQYPDNADIEGFRIYQGVTSLEATASANNRGGPIDNLAPGTSYHFDVRAFNAAGESSADACFVDVVTAE